MPRPEAHTFPMQWSWRLALALLPMGGALVTVLCGAELTGLAARGSLIGEAGDAERWAAVAFGLLVQPFGITALRHCHLSIDADRLHYLGFGFVCRSRTLEFAQVARWGTAVVTNRGRRELLTQRLGPPAPASASIAGVRFDA